jgi:hypothetical protein
VRRNDFSGGNLQGRKKGRCAVPLVIMALDRVQRASAANNTICARLTSRCGVVGARQRASST